MIDPTPRLTRAGREYALSGLPTSLVAKVALMGYKSDAGWPEGHVRAAINLCNECGKEKSSVKAANG